MIKNTPQNLAHSAAPAPGHSKPSPKWLQNISERVSVIVANASALPRCAPADRAGRAQEVKQAATNLLHVVRHFMTANYGFSPSLSDALRPLLASGSHPERHTAQLFALLPAASLSQVTTCIVEGDLIKLQQLATMAMNGPKQQASDVRRQLGELALHAVTTKFADQVIEVQAALDERVRQVSYEKAPAKRRGAISPPQADVKRPLMSADLGLAQPAAAAGAAGRPTQQGLTRPRTASAKIPVHPSELEGLVSLQSVYSQASAASSQGTFVSRIPIAEGTKTPITPKAYNARNELVKPRYSLVTQSGALNIGPLVVSHTLFQGSFGKVSYGMNEHHQTFALKSFRTFDPKLPAYANMSHREIMLSQRKATHLTQNIEVIEEAEQTQYFRENLDNFSARYDAINRPEDDSLKRVRMGIYGFEVHGIIVLPEQNNVQKMLMVMDREDGDLLTLRQYMPRSHLPALSLSAAAQLFTECEALHDRLMMAHFDIKMENVLFSQSGQIKHTDFGYAGTLEKDGERLASTALFGSLMTPEHTTVIDATQPNLRAYTAGTDVFALALTVVQVTADKFTPFALNRFMVDGAFSADKAAQFMADFSAYRDGLFVAGKLTPSRAGGAGPIAEFFGSCAQAHPELFALLMEHALHPDAEQRWSAAEIARETRRLLVAPGAPDFAALQEQIKAIAEGDEALMALEDQARAMFKP